MQRGVWNWPGESLDFSSPRDSEDDVLLNEVHLIMR